MEEVANAFLQYIDIVCWFYPVTPHHFFHRRLLIHLGTTRDSITLVMLEPGQLIRAFQIQPELCTGSKCCCQPLCGFWRNSALGTDQFTNQPGRPTNNFGKLDLAPAARLNFLLDELARRKYLCRSSLCRFHAVHPRHAGCLQAKTSIPVLVVVLNADDRDHFIRSCPLEFNNQSPLL